MDIEKIKALFNTYFVDVLKNHYTDFNGRANRPQYWYFVLFVFIISLVLGLIFSLAILVPSIGLGVRRLHDLGRPGWWYFGVLIPIVGPIALLVLFCMKGENKDNAYGKKA